MSTGFVWHELYMWHNNGMSVAYYYPNTSKWNKKGSKIIILQHQTALTTYHLIWFFGLFYC